MLVCEVECTDAFFDFFLSFLAELVFTNELDDGFHLLVLVPASRLESRLVRLFLSLLELLLNAVIETHIVVMILNCRELVSFGVDRRLTLGLMC